MPTVFESLATELVNTKKVLYTRIKETRETLNNYVQGRIGGNIIESAAALQQWPDQGLGRRQRPQSGSMNWLKMDLKTIVSGTFPATPGVAAEALTDGAVEWQDAQNRLNRFIYPHSKADTMYEEAIPLAMQNAFAGTKAILKKTGPLDERVQFMHVDPLLCGWEPFLGRYRWHTMMRQASDIRPHLLPEGCEPWDRVMYTEVYIRKFGDMQNEMLVYTRKWPSMPQPQQDWILRWAEMDIGEIKARRSINGSPISFLKFDPEVPGEGIPNAEVIDWMPNIEQMNGTLEKMRRVARQMATIYVWDGTRIDEEQIAAIKGDTEHAIIHWVKVMGSSGGNQGIDIQGLNDVKGVDSAIRPVEFAPLLRELTDSFFTVLSLHDRATGIQDLQRGTIPSGRQSATEIQVVNTNAQLINAFRRERVADNFAELANYVHQHQRETFGEEVRIPGDRDQVFTFQVPPPKVARFAMRVDSVELGHLAAQENAQLLSAGHQMILNTFAMIPSIGRKPVLESLRRNLVALGFRDVDALIPATVDQETPMERYQDFLLGHTEGIAVQDDDPHEVFAAEYNKILKKELQRTSRNTRATEELASAINEHEIMAAAQAPSTVQQAGGNSAAEGLANIQSLGNLIGNDNLPELTQAQ